MDLDVRIKLWVERLHDTNLSQNDFSYLEGKDDPFLNDVCLLEDSEYVFFMQLLETLALFLPYIKEMFNELGPEFRRTFQTRKVFWKRWVFVVAMRNWIAHHHPVIIWNENNGPADDSPTALINMKALLDEAGWRLVVRHKT